MRKYILSLFLSFVMTFVILPFNVSAEDNYEVYVGGVGLNSGDYLTVNTESVAKKTTSKPESGKYAYYKDGVLILNNYTYIGEGIINKSYGENYKYSLIFSEKDLEIILKGENTLTHTRNDSYSRDNGILVEGNLKISGSGKLSINASYAISSYTSITVSGSTLILKSDETAISAGNIYINSGTIDISSPFHGISSSNGEIEISGGTLDIEAYYPIYNTSGNITISGGVLNLTTNEERGDGIATYSDGTIKISGGKINIKACEHGILAGNTYGYTSQEETKIIVTGGFINIEANNGIRASFSDIIVSGGSLNIHTIDYGIYTEGNLNISGGNVLVDVADDKAAVQCNGEIILSDNLNITSNNDDLENTNYLKLISFYKLTFEANGGTFKGEDKYIIEQWSIEYNNTLTIPTKEGYTFKGYYTEKTGGTKFEMILNESGIYSDMTFYAQWEENSPSVPAIPEEEIPQTFDGIGSSIFMVTISLIGIVGTIIYLKKVIK